MKATDYATPNDFVVLINREGGRLFSVYKDNGKTITERAQMASQQRFALEIGKEQLVNFKGRYSLALMFIKELQAIQDEYRRECFEAKERRSAAFHAARRKAEGQ